MSIKRVKELLEKLRLTNYEANELRHIGVEALPAAIALSEAVEDFLSLDRSGGFASLREANEAFKKELSE
jgi:hypothetical protein